MSDAQNSRIYGIIVTILLTLAGAFGFFFWQKSQIYLEQNKIQETEKVTLLAEKSSIEHSLDSLNQSYAYLRLENENLVGKVTSTAALVAKKEAIIAQIKSTEAKDIKSLRKQVEDLKKTQIEFQTIIATLESENAQLKAENQRLTGENQELRGVNTNLTGQVDDLAKKLEEQIRKTQSAAFKASSFRVEMERRNNKLTTSARRVREISISFDLAEVPEQFQGNQKLYLVITDERGAVLPMKNPTRATVYAPTGPVEIQALQVRQVILEKTQRQSFTYKFDDRLKAGNYLAAIYCDKGLLGASSFRLQ
jgi:regulator of replication initiation timing